MNSKKLASITTTSILVVSIIATMMMPVSAQIDGGVTTTGDDRVIGGGTTETFNFTINDTRGDGIYSYITYINITNQTGFTFISGSNSTNITSDFSVIGVNLTWAISGVDFNETAGWFAFNATAPTLDDNRTDTWTTYALYNDTTVVSNTTFNVTVMENTLPVITTPPDQTVEPGSTEYITWNVIDTNPNKYWVLRNGVQVVAPTDYTSGVDFDVQIDTSTLGSWNYTIFANDIAGNEATDEVIITVAPRPLAFPEFNAIGLLALISILSITLAVSTLRRKR